VGEGCGSRRRDELCCGEGGGGMRRGRRAEERAGINKRARAEASAPWAYAALVCNSVGTDRTGRVHPMLPYTKSDAIHPVALHE
jgi:hypothetical protein